MNSRKRSSHWTRGRTSLLTTLFLTCCVLVTGFAVIGYFAGWVTFTHNPQEQKETIEVKTGKVQKAAAEAVEQGKELINKAGDKIDQLKNEGTTQQPIAPPAKTSEPQN